MVIIHIGTHKTGTKSIQKFLFEQISFLNSNGFDVYSGFHKNPKNHAELHLASLRIERDSFAKFNSPELFISEDYFLKVKNRVRAFLKDSKYINNIFSNEDLSWLRFDDEFERFRDIINAEQNIVKIILYIRNKSDFLKSYIKQIYAINGRVPSDDINSVLYVKENSWVLDFDKLILQYKKWFGENELTVIDYDQEIKTRNSIIPSFFEFLHLSLPGDFNIDEYYIHKS